MILINQNGNEEVEILLGFRAKKSRIFLDPGFIKLI